jgi:hypothetical protein
VGVVANRADDRLELELEAVVSIARGVLAGSVALVGFGLDSVVEVTSALVIVWRLS